MVEETSAEGDPQSNGAAESSVNVVKVHVRLIRMAVESASGVDVPADHDLLTWLVSYATSMHRRFSVGRDGKTGESSTDTEMGLVDVCVRFSVKNSEAKHRCEGGPVTLVLTKWDFIKADCRNKCRKLVENSKPLFWLDHRLILVERTRNGHGRFCIWHSSVSCTNYKCTRAGSSFTHFHIPQTVGHSQQQCIS